jgi:hypothetical protein
MALVWIPPLLRDLTAGSETANVPGVNVGQVIEAGSTPGNREKGSE